MLSLTPFLFILGVCVLGSGLFLQPLPVAAVSKFIVALIGNRKKGKNKMTASKTASCSFFFSKIYFWEEGAGVCRRERGFSVM